MQYREFAPPADLAPWIECAWTLRGAIAPAGQVILPDGRLELVFHFAAPPLTASGPQPVSLIAGRMPGPLELHARTAMDALGVRLRPGACAALVPCDWISKTEPMIDVLGNWARDAREQLNNGGIASLWPLLRRRLTYPPDAAVIESVKRIDQRRGVGAVDQFLPSGLSARQWQRRFLRSTGFTPKTFARLTRFQHLIALHRAGEHQRWAELALAAGFYDQAHLANEFRAFSGQSPEAFFRAGRGMADFYRDVPAR